MGETRVRKSKKNKRNPDSNVAKHGDNFEPAIEQLTLDCSNLTVPHVSSSDISAITAEDNSNFTDSNTHSPIIEHVVVQNPPTSYIEVKFTHGKGLAVFATRKIAPGTLILADTPLIRLIQAEEDADKESSMITTSALEMYFAALSKASQKTYLALFDSHKSTYTRVKSIYYSNCYNLSGASKPSKTSPGGSCIGATASRINHSCVPNVQFSFDETSNCMLFHAIRPIPKGKEVLSNYDSVFETVGQRRQKQTMYYGFACDCDACKGETEFWAKSDERRKVMIDAMREIKECERAYENLRHEDNARAGDNATGVGHDSSSHIDSQIVLKMPDPTPALSRLEAMLIKEGLVGLPLADCYRTMAKWAERMHDTNALRTAKTKELEVCRICMGETGVRTKAIHDKLVQIG